MSEPLWWQRGIVYQIYPRSFQDSNSDGIGDLRGICSRLEYLHWLGVDAIWISPIYPSPMADFGYDVADYRGVDPIFGSLAEFDEMIAKAHELGLRVILDFVPNHTSDQHPWFRESRSSRHNPKRDWYIWHDAAEDGAPPNNWLSSFGGSGWEWDEHTGQYYYHAFLKEQPDLNWRNPHVRHAMYDVLRFWLARGVDGFRVDVIWHLIKDAQFRNNPINPGYEPHDPSVRQYLQIYSADRPEVHSVISEMRDVIDEYEGRLLIGEIYLPIERLVAYYGEGLRGAHLPFNFQLIESPWNAQSIHRMIREYEDALPHGGWPNWVLSNHDQKRIASRIGVDEARVAAMLLLTLRGTPTLYYGDEIGMERVYIPPEEVHDPWEKNEPGLGVGRDPSRTPMQWDGSPYAGFSNVEPWLRLAEDYKVRNVQVTRDDPQSILNLYRRLIELRRQHPALTLGSYRTLEAHDHVLVYERHYGEDELIIALNLGREAHVLKLPEEVRPCEVALNTFLDSNSAISPTEIRLRPSEGVILEPCRT
jgi:alpha-glucosidase